MVAGDYLIIITNYFLKYETNKSKVVTKKVSKCKYSQLLATSDEESDMDDDAQPITKENRNETDNKDYTSSDDTSVSSEENASDNKSSHDDKILKEIALQRKVKGKVASCNRKRIA